MASTSPVLILTGPPGVGKTTAAAALAAGGPAVHLEADAFFRFVAGGYIEPWKPESHEQNRAVMGAVAAAAAAYAGAGYTVVIDGIVIPRWFLAPLAEDLRAAGHEAAYAVLRAPLQTCLARLREREATLDEAAVEGIWSQFAALGEFEGHAIDVAGLDPDEVVAAVRRQLDAGRLTL